MKLKSPPLIALVTVALALVAATHAATAAPSVRAIRTHLFESKTGRLSEDILAAPTPSLWNSFAGPQAANAALVVIEIDGQPLGAYTGRPGALPSYSLRLVANERGRARPLLDARQPLPVLGEDGKAYLAFLIRPSGCAAIQLSATLMGPQASATKPKVATLPMACGE
jgi:hypothetical protein